jgi:uncharacterized membrane protein
MSKQTWHRYGDLFLLIGLCVSLALIIYLAPSSPLRIVGGVLCILYAPGYALLAALYPDKKAINRGQRFSASIGLSVAISSLLNLMITYSVGTSLHSSFGVLAFWIVVMVLIAGYRRRLTPAFKRFTTGISIRPAFWQEKNPLQRGLFLATIGAIILLGLAAGRLIWVSDHTAPQFTEFYLLGPSGLSEEYPEHILAGHPITVTVGIVHHGRYSQNYGLFYQINDSDYQLINNIVLNNEEKWESEVEIYPLQTPTSQKVVFGLYKEGEAFPYDTLHLWITAEDFTSSPN